MDKTLKWLTEKIYSEQAPTIYTNLDDMENMMTSIFNIDETLYQVVSDTMSHYTIKAKYHYSQVEKLTIENISKTNLISITEERLIEYVETSFTVDYIRESGSYIYQVIQEKAYEIAMQTLDNHKDDYDFNDDTDALAEAIFEHVDFDYIYDIIDNIIVQPSTIQEKMADIGMSQQDFL